MYLVAVFCLLILIYLGDTEIHENKDEIKRQTNLAHRGPRHITNVCHLLSPPPFSLQTTFKDARLAKLLGGFHAA
jgi:hypothetical protein